jgi:D-amino peptidase
MVSKTVFLSVLAAVGLAVVIAIAVSRPALTAQSKKVFMITDMEGVDGVFDEELQCVPWKSPRWEESRKLLTGEINAAVDGLDDGGATEVVVLDGHWSGSNLSVSDINPKARLLTGTVPRSFTLDRSYSAMIFIGQHAMAGAEKGILGHTEDPEGVQNVSVNSIPVGEIGLNLMVAASFGVPTIMLSGDTAACKELQALVPQAECAEVKSGVSRTGGLMLPHSVACALIREKCRRAMERLAEIKPYQVSEPVEIRVDSTTVGTRVNSPREGVEQLNDRTRVIRGKNFMEAWYRF